MNNTAKLFLVTSIHEEMRKEAAANLLERGLGYLGRGAEQIESRMPNNSFSQGVGRLASRAVPQLGASSPSWLSKLLVGSRELAPATQDMGLSGLENHFQGELGKRLLSRGTVGGALGYGGLTAAEAPGKYENNQRFAQQQAHPIRSWLSQHLQGKPKLQHESYLSPF
jgi:hypothetical protein